MGKTPHSLLVQLTCTSKLYIQMYMILFMLSYYYTYLCAVASTKMHKGSYIASDVLFLFMNGYMPSTSIAVHHTTNQYTFNTIGASDSRHLS